MTLAARLAPPEPLGIGAHQSNHISFRAEHRRRIRIDELEKVIALIPPGSRVLEVGAGAGWQAKTLAERGFDVVAIDIASSNYNTLREWDVITYDGSKIPLPGRSFDVVFSSNVLEHIPHVAEFQREMMRVLKPGGIAIHVMPTSTWRTWTTLSFYVHRIQQVFGVKVHKSVEKLAPTGPVRIDDRKIAPTIAHRLRRALIPPCHGVRGNVITEAGYFSGRYWRNLFKKTGWSIRDVRPNRLFYTGFRVLGPNLSMRTRRALSHILGSSCKIYVLELKKSNDKVTSLYN